MEYYAGIDVSLESSSICVVDATGRIVREAKVASEPEALTAWYKGLGFGIGLPTRCQVFGGVADEIFEG
jgi:transposase